MLVFAERGKLEYPEKKLSEQSREPTNATHFLHRVRDSNLAFLEEERSHHCAISAPQNSPRLVDVHRETGI